MIVLNRNQVIKHKKMLGIVFGLIQSVHFIPQYYRRVSDIIRKIRNYKAGKFVPKVEQNRFTFAFEHIRA